MRVFALEEVDASFGRQAKGKIDIEYNWKQFSSYDDFERYMFKERKPLWVAALVALSGCKKQSDFELQWDLWGKIFRKFHADRDMNWMACPESCPLDVIAAREEELAAALDSFVEQGKCHWKRDHRLVCFCDQDV